VRADVAGHLSAGPEEMPFAQNSLRGWQPTDRYFLNVMPSAQNLLTYQNRSIMAADKQKALFVYTQYKYSCI